MLQKEFFQVQPFNPNPYWDPVIVNLSGAQKFEENTVFIPGKYKIEIAPGGAFSTYTNTVGKQGISNIECIENISQYFIVRAYCGSDGYNGSVGTNPYSGVFKVNGCNTNNHSTGIDVNHIFGAGGGNSFFEIAYLGSSYQGGGPNCLGNGSIGTETGVYAGTIYGGAGSCLHLLPVNGVFGVDYIRAYHVCPCQSSGNGSAYGGAQAGLGGNGTATSWFTRGGNSPYGNGGINHDDAGQGVGAGGLDDGLTVVGAGAYFNGTVWVDAKGNGNSSKSSYIKITYVGPLNS